METGREHFSKFLRGEPLSRPAFVPMLGAILTRVEKAPLETLTNDPTLWANSLKKTAELFDLDGVVAGFDFTLMAEACGCNISWEKDEPSLVSITHGLAESPEETGRMKHALEAARRVFEVCRPRQACVAAVTGPATLAALLFGEEEGPTRLGDVKQPLTRVTEAFCGSGADMVCFLEGSPLCEITTKHRRAYNTLKNILNYYNIPSCLYLEGYRPEDVRNLGALNMDAYVLGPSLKRDLPDMGELWALGEGSLGVGVALPVADQKKTKEILTEAIALHGAQGRGFFFTSLGPLTGDENLEAIHELAKEISELNLHAKI